VNPKPEEGDKDFRREAGEVFIANLKRVRNESGLSQENLSLRASLARTHVGLIENGKMLPEMETVYQLAGVLEVEPAELIKGIYWQPDDSDAGGHATREPPTKEARS
jgi:transcriptional regulator with XRE-family HTH domain